MPTISMTVRGGEQLTRNLRRLAGNERRQAQHDGLEAGARVGETWAKIICPVDLGTLMNSIQVHEVTPIQATYGPSDVDYAEHVEFGTVNMAAQPYLRPSLDEHEREIVDAVQRTVAAFVESIRA
jgi:HK97 gp10 family phage protein